MLSIGSGEIANAQYQIFNTTGIQVQTGTIADGKIDVSMLKNGFYYLKVSSSKNNHVTSLSIQH